MNKTDSNQNTQPELVEPVKQKPKTIWFVVAIIGILLLGSAAFLGARLLNQKNGGDKSMYMGIGPSGSGSGISVGDEPFEILPANEIPVRRAEATGLISKIKDRSLFVRTGSGFAVAISEDGGASSNVVDEGPTVEVVVTEETKIYIDVTPGLGTLEEGGSVQQVVELVDFGEINTDTILSVWGSKRGDRLIADTILYSRPVASVAPVK